MLPPASPFGPKFASAVPCLVANEPKGPSDETRKTAFRLPSELAVPSLIGYTTDPGVTDGAWSQSKWQCSRSSQQWFFRSWPELCRRLTCTSREGNEAAFVIHAVTQWADLPVALGLLGAALLAWYQTERSCAQIENWLREDEWYEGTLNDEELAAEIDRIVASGLRRLRRQRFAVVCVGLLGLLTAAASLTFLYWVFTLGANSALSPWGYLSVVLSRLPVGVPALACVVIAPTIWARSSDLLRRDDSGAGFKDEPEHPAAPEPIS